MSEPQWKWTGPKYIQTLCLHDPVSLITARHPAPARLPRAPNSADPRASILQTGWCCSMTQYGPTCSSCPDITVQPARAAIKGNPNLSAGIKRRHEPIALKLAEISHRRAP
ncbi:hypothetical protein DPEC_G00273060 [Dallia pectoralis]|uniref:Uncharacterized protein n=1 Tax=Dallia pectoralis TaxID=75939 RepID=A0ACC2FQI1_DALPE|nr:hypothetical protein DPEC_G00273060 [Dallia pectoralis]